jgi:hypothetical protein
VGVTEVGARWLVHYRRTLIAELDPRQTGSVLVDPS